MIPVIYDMTPPGEGLSIGYWLLDWSLLVCGCKERDHRQNATDISVRVISYLALTVSNNFKRSYIPEDASMENRSLRYGRRTKLRDILSLVSFGSSHNILHNCIHVAFRAIEFYIIRVLYSRHVLWTTITVGSYPLSILQVSYGIIWRLKCCRSSLEAPVIAVK